MPAQDANAHMNDRRPRSQDIVSFGERQALKRAIAAVESLHAFFSRISTQITHQENANQEAE